MCKPRQRLQTWRGHLVITAVYNGEVRYNRSLVFVIVLFYTPTQNGKVEVVDICIAFMFRVIIMDTAVEQVDTAVRGHADKRSSGVGYRGQTVS